MMVYVREQGSHLCSKRPFIQMLAGRRGQSFGMGYSGKCMQAAIVDAQLACCDARDCRAIESTADLAGIAPR